MPQTDILLVDASRPARYPMRLLLQRLGAKVRTADSAEQALELIAAAPPDAVLAARILPAMNALELLELMHANSATAMIPVIIYCADGDWPLRPIALARGAAAVLTPDRAELELPALLADIDAGNRRTASTPLLRRLTPVASWRLSAANDIDTPSTSRAQTTGGTVDLPPATSAPGLGGGATRIPLAQTDIIQRMGHSFAVGAAVSAIALMILALVLMAW